ncbi:hypothetical protein BKA62DRAFT_686466 [Auriculariales sp. MPI-PUGE-AT-0066]|nr:hypothetical protein BKA62DRAFT_686466 [Auriculariales sp. MPI-PUGE-AT-0066]
MSWLGFVCDTLLLAGTPFLVAFGVLTAWRNKAISFGLRGWLRFPLAVALTVALEFALGGILLLVNPFVYESTHRPLLVLSLVSLAYLTTHIPVTLVLVARPEEHHELKLLFQAYTFWWFVLALPTDGLIGRVYTRLIFVALVTALLAGLFDRWYAAQHGVTDDESEEHAPLLHPTFEPGYFPRHEVPPCQPPPSPHTHWHHSAISGAFDVPFVLLLGTQLAFTFHLSVKTHYSSLSSAYVDTTCAVILIMLPLTPFTHHFHRVATTAIALLLVASTILALATFPFSRATPLRLQFTHSVSLHDGNTFTELAGPRGYFESHISPALSADTEDDEVWLALPPTRLANCSDNVQSRFHEDEFSEAYGICRWPGPTTRMWPWPPSHWIKEIETKPLGLTRGVLVVSGPAYTHFISIKLDNGIELDAAHANPTELELKGHGSDPGDDGRRGVPWERIFIVEWPISTKKGQRGGYVVVGWDESPDQADVPDLYALRAGVPDWVQVTGPRTSMPEIDGFARFDF